MEKKKQRGLFLMRSPAPRCREARTQRQCRCAPALRFLTCGSVDDGKSTLIGRLLYEQKLIFDDHLATLERDSKKHGTTGERHRFRAAARRAGSRARAGHHHRRRLSVFHHRRAHLHGRRHAGPRAIYPQHGDRRLQCRPRGSAGRRAQRRADPDPPPRHHRSPARHPPRRAGGEQDRPDGFRSSRVRRIVAEFSRFAADLVSQPSKRSRCRRVSATTSSRSEHTPWYQGRICSTISKRSTSRRTGRQAVPLAGAMGQPAEFRFPRLLPARS